MPRIVNGQQDMDQLNGTHRNPLTCCLFHFYLLPNTITIDPGKDNPRTLTCQSVHLTFLLVQEHIDLERKKKMLPLYWMQYGQEFIKRALLYGLAAYKNL